MSPFNKTTGWLLRPDYRLVGRPCGKGGLAPNTRRLLQLYAVHKATIEARKRGHTVQRKLQKNGAIKLVIGGV